MLKLSPPDLNATIIILPLFELSILG